MLMAAGPAQASVVTDIVTKLGQGCSSGMGSQVCKSAMSWATQLCRKYKTVCEQVAGPLCKATGTYAKQCDLGVKAITNPAGALTSLFG